MRPVWFPESCFCVEAEYCPSAFAGHGWSVISILGSSPSAAPSSCVPLMVHVTGFSHSSLTCGLVGRPPATPSVCPRLWQSPKLRRAPDHIGKWENPQDSEQTPEPCAGAGSRTRTRQTTGLGAGTFRPSHLCMAHTSSWLLAMPRSFLA